MARKSYYNFFAVLTALLIGSIIFSSLLEKVNYTEQKQADVKKSIIYTVCDLDGKIAVYKNDDDTPLYVYSVLVKNLPPQDQEALKNGITLDSNEKLIRLIEDYTS